MDKSYCYRSAKQLMVLFAFGILSGCIYFNIIWQIQGPLFQNEWGMIFERFMSLSLREIEQKLLDIISWIYIVHIVILVLGFTRIGKIVIEGTIVSYGFLIGAAETLLLLGFDIKDGIYFLAKMVLIQIPYMLFLGIGNVAAYSMSLLNRSVQSKVIKWKISQLKKYLFLALGTLISHLVYILLLDYVNYIKIFEKFF